MKTANQELNSEDTSQDSSKTNVVPLKAIGGGRGEGYWLLELEAGAHFLTKLKREHSELNEFWLVGIGERARLLELVMADGTSIRKWVDPIQFSKDMILYEILEK